MRLTRPSVPRRSAGGHFNLVHYQMYQIRSAFALAQITGRVLIMPPIWCGLDRSWFGHFGVFPGSDLELPFLCPMDHVFGVEDWYNNRFSDKVGGPHVKFREYSFLLVSLPCPGRGAGETGGGMLSGGG